MRVGRRSSTAGRQHARGGGTATLFATALDTRLAMSLPSYYFCTFKASILAMSHCSCNYAPGLLNRCGMPDVAGVHEAYAQVREVYEALGAEGHLELYVGPEGHRDYKARVWDFVRRNLKGGDSVATVPGGPTSSPA